MNNLFAYSRICLHAIILTLFIGVTSAYAQSNYVNSRNMGLGGGGVAYMGGYESMLLNPANLGFFRGKNQFMLGLPGDISFDIGGPLANISLYNKYFTKGLQLNGNRVNSLLSQWFGASDSKMNDLGTNVNFLPMAYVHKKGNYAFGIAVNMRTLANVGLDKGLAYLMLRGFNPNYFNGGKPVDFYEDVYSTIGLSLSFSTKLTLGGSIPDNQGLYVGISPELIGGLAYSSARFSSVLNMSGDTLIQNQFKYTINTVGPATSDFQNFYNQRISTNQTPSFNDIHPADFAKGGLKGMGFGLNIGATYVVNFNTRSKPFTDPMHNEFLTVSVAVTDIGKVNFTKNPMQFTASNTINWDGLSPNYQQINSKYNGSLSNYINHVAKDSIARGIYGAYVPNKISKVSIGLPTVISMGAYFKYKRLGLMLDIGKGMNNYGMNSKNLYVATGAELYLLSFLPIRVGYHMGGKTSNSFSLGTGLEFRNFQISVGAMTDNNSINRGLNLSTAISTKLLFY